MSKKESLEALYVDSSVLVALLAPGDRHHRSAIRLARADQRPLVTSSVSEVEIGRALGRRAAPASLQEAARELMDHCEIVDLIPEIRLRAVEVRPASVRSLDAIHVATALLAGMNRFASFDARQRIAAEEMGLKLVGAV
ncbi:MAG TPA: type II toxin-antitoxin system VapC family toxin [Candidatus Dormibacteraeota bacterium]|nr:type II toxin-antitoxin system VapC family toxin [Candidatus Dormibacteraeota bacterium]